MVTNIEQNSQQLIGIVGFISSGKDTIAEYLVNVFNFKQESFASSLKDAVSVIFGWDREMLEGRTKYSREWREQVDTWWANRLNMPQLTPRWILQNWGTEVCRGSFHDDIWIASLENKLRKTTDNIVISDVRFPNEFSAIKNSGGKIIWVKRGELPEWYDTALLANQGDNNSIELLKSYNIHPSEWSWIGSTFDAIVENNSTIEDLYSQVRTLIS